MDKSEIIEYCLSLKDTYAECPFPGDMESTTIKHKNSKKWFALIMNVKGEVYLNVKTNPDYSDLLRNTYDYIIPAYHMNKELWNTAIVSRNVDKNLIKEIIKQSYDLTQSKKERKL